MSQMRTPFKASLFASLVVFVAAVLATIFHEAVVDGRVLTPLELLPLALVTAVFFAGLALLGTWLGLRRAAPRRVTYSAGLIVSVIYIAATTLANALIHAPARTVTVPSHAALVDGLQAMAIGIVWGIAAPWLIALAVSRVSTR